MNKILRFTVFAILFFTTFSLSAQDEKSEIIGRWDIVMQMNGDELPSWLEVYKSGHNTLVGRFVFAFGSARPVAEIHQKGELYQFSIPKQWEPEGIDMSFIFKKKGEVLTGTMIYTDGTSHEWTASRAPKLAHNPKTKWDKSIKLFNRKNLDGWYVKGRSEWKVEKGILKNTKAGGNLISDQNFDDFKLMVEFRYPEGSNSGIYLRGRYEVQIEDNYGMEPSPTLFGGVYGFLSPNEMAAKKPGKWQKYEITLIGRRVTIVANGKKIITDQIIPGITGGALDSREGEPGPIFIQGDHGPIEFKSVVITPAKK